MGGCLRALAQGTHGRASNWPSAIYHSPASSHVAISAAKSRSRILCRLLRSVCCKAIDRFDTGRDVPS